MIRLFIITCLIPFTGYAQQAHLYYPNGERYKGDHHSIEQISHDFEDKARVYHYSPFVAGGDEVTTVGFLLFTDSAMWVLTRNPAHIDSAINHFDLDKFYDSREFQIELDAFIANESLNEEFIIKTLGEPASKREFVGREGKFDRWEYKKLSLYLILEDGVVTHKMPIEGSY